MQKLAKLVHFHLLNLGFLVEDPVIITMLIIRNKCNLLKNHKMFGIVKILNFASKYVALKKALSRHVKCFLS